MVGYTLQMDVHMGVSKNNGTPKSSILIGFSIIFTIHFGGKIPYFWFNTHVYQTLDVNLLMIPIYGAWKNGQSWDSILGQRSQGFQQKMCWLHLDWLICSPVILRTA